MKSRARVSDRDPRVPEVSSSARSAGSPLRMDLASVRAAPATSGLPRRSGVASIWCRDVAVSRWSTIASVMVHFSGFYAWLKEPLCHRALEDARQTDLIRQAWADSGKVYGYRKLHDDLRDQGESCSKNRVARLASLAGMVAQIGYRRRPGRYGGKPAVVAENKLEQQFEVDAPNRVWVTDITYIKTHEGWLYLSVVIDLFSRRIVGWSMQSLLTTELVLQALLMAVWRRKPKVTVTIHSDQGSQFTSREWQSFLHHHNLDASMSRRGNCHDNAVAESFFQLLKRGGAGHTPHAKRQGRTCSNTSISSTTQSESTRTTACCRPLTLKLDSRN